MEYLIDQPIPISLELLLDSFISNNKFKLSDLILKRDNDINSQWDNIVEFYIEKDLLNERNLRYLLKKRIRY